MTKSKPNSWLFAYLGTGIVWGASFLFISMAIQSFSPVGVAFWRMALGAAPIAIVAIIKRLPWPKTPIVWFHLLIVSLCMNAIPSFLFSYAELHVSSALAGIINAATPITTVLVILIAFREEKPKPYLLTGLLVGFIGVIVVLGIWNGFGKTEPLAIGALILAVTLYGIGGPYARRYLTPLKLPIEVHVASQVGISAVLLAPIYLTGPLLVAPLTWQAFVGISCLGLIGTGIAYIWYYQVMAAAGSAIANSVTYLSPVVAVIAGASLLREQISWNQLLGGAVVILGAMIAHGRLNKVLGFK